LPSIAMLRGGAVLALASLPTNVPLLVLGRPRQTAADFGPEFSSLAGMQRMHRRAVGDEQRGEHFQIPALEAG
jgi:hypothetical protein